MICSKPYRIGGIGDELISRTEGRLGNGDMTFGFSIVSERSKELNTVIAIAGSGQVI